VTAARRMLVAGLVLLGTAGVLGHVVLMLWIVQ